MTIATQRFVKHTEDNYTNQLVNVLQGIVNVWENCSKEDWQKHYPVHEGNHPQFKIALDRIKALQYQYGPVKYCDVKDKAPLPQVTFKEYELFYSEVWGYTVDKNGHQIFQLGH